MPDEILASRRHDLVRVEPSAWAAMLFERPDLDDVPHLAGWADAGRPLIVRRFAPGEARDRIPLGLPLPPADGKRRIGSAVSPSEISPFPAPTLGEARAAAPAAWHPTLDALIALGAGHGIAPRPFGGLLWQAVTGLRYLTDASDLDVLWPLSEPVPPNGLLDGIASIAADAPMRLDGEILFPDGAGIHWRELHEAPDDGEVIAKSLDRLAFRSVAALQGRGPA